MGFWPDGAVTREAVEAALLQPIRWRVEWCDGARRDASEGFGRTLPGGVLEAVPTRAKKRKIDRGQELDKTWVFAYLRERDGERVFDLQEGP